MTLCIDDFARVIKFMTPHRLCDASKDLDGLVCMCVRVAGTLSNLFWTLNFDVR
jgi:hypothetical protein